MFYVYVYLNPLKKGCFKTSLGEFSYEPIYVGKGKGSRIYHHLTPKMLKTKNHRYHLLTKIVNDIGIDEYKEKYVIKIIDNLSNDIALELEYILMTELGTVYDIHPTIKKGPLLNFTLCGVKNPILYGERNPMYKKNIYDIWKDKYPIHIAELMIHDLNKIRSVNSLEMWGNIKDDKVKYSHVCENIKQGVNSYWSSLSVNEYQEIINERSSRFKEFYKKYGSFEKYFIEKFGETEGLLRESKRKKSIQASLISYWKNIDEESYNLHNEKTRAGLYKFFEKYGSLDNYLFDKLGEEEFLKRKKRIKKNLSDAHLKRWASLKEEQRKEHSKKLKNAWSLKTDKEKEEYSLKMKGSNNPMYKKGNLVKGSKNGRSTQWIIHTPDDIKYYCNGSFKRFCKDILRQYKPQPHRKYLNDILKTNEPINGWYFKKVDYKFNPGNKYIIYE